MFVIGSTKIIIDINNLIEVIDSYVAKHLLRYWPIFARSPTLHFAGAVNTRQIMTVHINNLVPSEFPNRSSRSARSLISTLICI